VIALGGRDIDMISHGNMELCGGYG
jgi:hypothetical protein